MGLVTPEMREREAAAEREAATAGAVALWQRGHAKHTTPAAHAANIRARHGMGGNAPAELQAVQRRGQSLTPGEIADQYAAAHGHGEHPYRRRTGDFAP